MSAQVPPLPLGNTGINLPVDNFNKACDQAEILSKWEQLSLEVPQEDLPEYLQPNFLRQFIRQHEIDIDFVRDCWRNGFIGVDPHIVREIIPQIKIHCNTGDPVLITGETGSGKEVVAQCIHKVGNRRDKPFTPINCAAIPTDLLESELFGYEKGAHSTAKTGKPGLFEVADGGTLFLDELGELPLDLQAKLLRVLDNRKFNRLGGTKERVFKARVLAATNKNLQAAIDAGHFREDLLFRLNGGSIHIWPLYLRPGDLLLFIYYFLCEYNRDKKTQVEKIGYMALHQAMFYRWKGGIRELKNVIYRSCNIFLQSDTVPLPVLDLYMDDAGLKYFDPNQRKKLKNLFLLGHNVEDLPAFDIVSFMEMLGRYRREDCREQWRFKKRLERILEEALKESPRKPKTSDSEKQQKRNPFEEIANFSWKEVREKYAKQLVKNNNGNTSKAAKAAGVPDKRTFEGWLKK